ncbi:VOC family protein [Streptomyces sp. NPDC050422]|uniref:VOC family protein n=1 Tax=Streptomyces sp. NPDC050422 TaxID=3365614 RepID=UPI0037BCD729
MVSELQNVAVDCADAYALARFWGEALGRPLHPDDKPGDPEVDVMLPEGPLLHFNQVPEPKTVKNRLHLCLRPKTTREEEVARLLDLGATLVDDRREPDGAGWAVLADPEGNEFCVLRSTADRAAMPSQEAASSSDAPSS